MSNLLALQNGSDIRGIALDTEDLQANLTEQEAKLIASGIIRWYVKKMNKVPESLKVGIGCDSRLTGPSLKQAMIETFNEYGVAIIDFQMATTPAMFMSTQFAQFDCDIAIMLTASHLPYYYNGIKIFTKEGGVEKEDIQQILSLSLEKQNYEFSHGSLRTADLLSPYATFLVEKIQTATKQDRPLSGWHIIVDAGNGAGGFFAQKVLEVLGADTSGSQFLEPDGHFPNHIPNPDNKEAMASISQAVLDHQADLGVIFDTDVDRSALVTKDGMFLNRNNLIAVLSQIVLHEHPGSSIVTNSPTSSHLKTFIESLGGKQVRYISGYRNVINKAVALNQEGIDCQLAIETSGHAAFKENYFLDDGAYVIAKVLMLLPKLKAENRSLEDLIATLQQPAETLEVRFKLEVDAFKDLGQQVIDSFRTWQVEDIAQDLENHEGVRFNVTGKYGSGWFLLRMSLHEPLLVLQVENDEKGKIPLVLQQIHEQMNQFPKVNQEKLLAHL